MRLGRTFAKLVQELRGSNMLEEQLKVWGNNINKSGTSTHSEQ